MKKFLTLSFLVVSLNSMASVESCLSNIKVIQDAKVSTMEKNTVKQVKECFKELKTAEKTRQKELKKAARAEKTKKALMDKIAKMNEKLKSLN